MADANGRPAELNDVISSYRNNGMSWYTWENTMRRVIKYLTKTVCNISI